jgi:hypothetical protein
MAWLSLALLPRGTRAEHDGDDAHPQEEGRDRSRERTV